jgi:hypothetical protein
MKKTCLFPESALGSENLDGERPLRHELRESFGEVRLERSLFVRPVVGTSAEFDFHLGRNVSGIAFGEGGWVMGAEDIVRPAYPGPRRAPTPIHRGWSGGVPAIAGRSVPCTHSRAVILEFSGSPEQYVEGAAQKEVLPPPACPACGEIDCLESLGYYPRGFQVTPFRGIQAPRHSLRLNGSEEMAASLTEQFENDGSPVPTIVKGVKRAMAGEYSWEPSSKVFQGAFRSIRYADDALACIEQSRSTYLGGCHVWLFAWVAGERNGHATAKRHSRVRRPRDPCGGPGEGTAVE